MVVAWLVCVVIGGSREAEVIDFDDDDLEGDRSDCG
jgi:hypothetical protein